MTSYSTEGISSSERPTSSSRATSRTPRLRRTSPPSLCWRKLGSTAARLRSCSPSDVCSGGHPAAKSSRASPLRTVRINFDSRSSTAARSCTRSSRRAWSTAMARGTPLACSPLCGLSARQIRSRLPSPSGERRLRHPENPLGQARSAAGGGGPQFYYSPPSYNGGGFPPVPEYHGPVHVNGYTRKDGTYVQPHTRRAPRR